MIRAEYDQIAREFEAARVQLQTKEFDYLALVEAPLVPGGTVLLIGCGTGRSWVSVELYTKWQGA